MKKSMLAIRICMLIYLLILFPFFHFVTPIRFLLIDSFLAYLPIEFYFATKKVEKTGAIYLFGFLYVLFLPNNLYLLTDLIHLSRISFYIKSSAIMTENSFNWLMFALVIIGIFSLTLIGFQTEIDSIHRLKSHYKWTFLGYCVIQVFLFVAVSCGVFLGRFIRLNSIQLFTNSLQIVEDSGHLFTKKGIIFVMLFTLIQLIFLGILKVSHYLFHSEIINKID